MEERMRKILAVLIAGAMVMLTPVTAEAATASYSCKNPITSLYDYDRVVVDATGGGRRVTQLWYKTSYSRGGYMDFDMNGTSPIIRVSAPVRDVWYYRKVSLTYYSGLTYVIRNYQSIPGPNSRCSVSGHL